MRRPRPLLAPPFRRRLSPAEAGRRVHRRRLGNRRSLAGWRCSPQPDRLGQRARDAFRNGAKPATDSGLEDLRDVVSIAAGDFDNDGLPDLCVVTAQAALLYRNTGGQFKLQSELASGAFRKALWWTTITITIPICSWWATMSRLLRNNGEAGFSDETKRFPFVAGRALDAVRFDLEPDTPGFDLAVSYADRAGVLYRDSPGRHVCSAGHPGTSGGRARPRGGRCESRWPHRPARACRRAGLLLVNRDAKFQPKPRRSSPNSPSPSRSISMARAGRTAPHRRRRRPLPGPRHDADVRQLDRARAHRREERQAGRGRADRDQGGNGYRKVTYEGVPVVVRLGARTQSIPCASPGRTG